MRRTEMLRVELEYLLKKALKSSVTYGKAIGCSAMQKDSTLGGAEMRCTEMFG
jgi:hypothetical protein